MKRILLIIAAIVVLIGIGVAVYFLFFAPKAVVPVATSDTTFPEGAASAPAATAQEVGVPVADAGTDVAPRLVRISDRPVVFGTSVVFIPGTASTSKATTTTPFSTTPDVAISYIERESGNVYTFMATARTLTRVSNKTLPGIYDASWTPTGSVAFVRFLEKGTSGESIRSFALPRSGEGSFALANDIAQMFVTGSSTLITVQPNAAGASVTSSTIQGTGAKTLFSTLLSRFRLTMGGATTLLTTKASYNLDGYAFTVAKDGTMTRVLGPLTGLTALVSPSGKTILYSYMNGKRPSLAVYDTVNKTAVSLPLSTFTEKCVWSADSLSIYCAVPTSLSGNLPDDWYQGAVHTSDRLWKIGLTDRVASQIVDLETVGAGKIDAVSLMADRSNEALVFTDKVTGSLWMYQL